MFDKNKKTLEEKAPEIDFNDYAIDESDGWCSAEFPQGCVLNEDDE